MSQQEENQDLRLGIGEVREDKLQPKKEWPNRPQVIQALNHGLTTLDSEIKSMEQNGQTPDPKLPWVLDEVQDAQRKVAESENKDGTFTNIWNNPEKGRDFSLKEGIPVDDLIEFLKEKAGRFLPGEEEKEKILKDAEILKNASDPFYKVHEKELKDDPQDVLRDARIKFEANLISKDYRASHNPDDQQRQAEDYFKGLETLKKRTELIIPPETEEKKKEEEEEKHEKKKEDDHEEPELPKTLEVNIAALKQHIEHTSANRRIKEMELLEEGSRELASARMTEDRTKWEGRFSFLRQAIPRFWKFTFGEVSTRNKEKNHSMRLLAKSGLQMGEIPYKLFNALDAEARNHIRQNRHGFRRITGGLRDLFHEITFTEKDLHRERENIMSSLRTALEHPREPQNAAFLQTALGREFQNVATGDFQASEAVSKRLSDISGNELIHGLAGETKAGQKIVLEGPVGDFFKKQIINPLLQEGLTNNGQISDATLLEARTKVQEFFFSKEFINWHDNQPQEIRDAMKLSLSWGTDLIPMIKEVLLPQALQAKEHLESAADIERYMQNVLLKVNVGTLEGGTKGSMGEGLVERAATKSITSERVLGFYQKLRTRNTALNLTPDTYASVPVKRAEILGNLTRLATNEIAAGMAVGFGLYAFKVGAGTLGRFALPLVGGSIVAGGMRALQERRLFTREYEQHEIEKAKGYEFPADARRRREMQGLERHKRNMTLELTEPMGTLGNEILSHLENNTKASDAEIFKMLGLLADTNARFQIMDIRGIDLLSATAPGHYQVEKTQLEISRAKSMAVLDGYLNTNHDQLVSIAQALGMPQGSGVYLMVNELTQNQIQHLESGVGINASYQAALGNLTITENQSIRARENAFSGARRRRMFVMGASTAAFGIFGGLVTQEAIALGGRALGARMGQTILEKGVNFVAGHFGHPEVASAPIGIDTFTDLYQNRGSVNLGNNLQATAVDNHIIVLQDQTTGSYIGAGKLTEDGRIYEFKVGDGVNRAATERLENSFKNLGFNTQFNTLTEKAPSDLAHIKELLSSGQSETITKGPIELRVNGPTHEFVLNDTSNHIQFQGPIDSDGQLIMDHARYPQADFDKLASSLKAAGFDVSADKTPGQTITKEVIEAFRDKGVVEKAQRILWHDNGTPGRFDGKELQFHHHAAGGDIDLDMSRMVSKMPGGINWDNTVDPEYSRVAKDIIVNADGSRVYKNFEFLITPNDVADQARDVIKIAVDANGHAKIPDGSDLRQFFAIENGRPVQLARFIEVAHTEHDASGNLLGRTILSTSVGRGIDNIQINIPGHDLLKAIPSDEPNIFQRFNLAATPPQVTEAPPIPIIPGRRPLEEPEEGSQDRGKDTPGPQRTPQKETQREGEAPVVPGAESRKPLEESERNDLQVKRQEFGRLLSEPEPTNPAEMKAKEAKLNQLHNEIKAAEEKLPTFSTEQEIPEMFKQVEGPVNTGHPYFIANPPVSFTALDPAKQSEILNAIPSAKPFFVKGQGNSYQPNPEITPVWDFEQNADTRFLNAEAATDHDSGLLAIAAASAPTPEKQGDLYKTMAEAVIAAHLKNPNLINEWLSAQRQQPIGFSRPEHSTLTSLNLFLQNDFVSNAQKADLFRPRQVNERLILDSSGKNMAQMQPFWQARIAELSQKLQEGKLEPHHLRWIEFLSHSVDVGKLMQMIKEASPEPKMNNEEILPSSVGGAQSQTTGIAFEVNQQGSFDNEYEIEQYIITKYGKLRHQWNDQIWDEYHAAVDALGTRKRPTA